MLHGSFRRRPRRTHTLTPLGDRVRLPWSLLDWPHGVPEPTQLALCWMSDDDLAHLLGGRVLHGDTFDGDAVWSASPGGLFDEHVFGKLARDQQGGVALPDRRKQPVFARPQSRRFGTIELPAAVSSPW